MKKKVDDSLDLSGFEARWKRRSPENASVEVLENAFLASDETEYLVNRPKRIDTAKRRIMYGTLTYHDVAVLHLALTRQYQRTGVDSVAAEYETLLGRLEDILEERPTYIRFY